MKRYERPRPATPPPGTQLPDRHRRDVWRDRLAAWPLLLEDVVDLELAASWARSSDRSPEAIEAGRILESGLEELSSTLDTGARLTDLSLALHNLVLARGMLLVALRGERAWRKR